ncbi:MAG TPA: D-alanyl-D-alanine carboxypeptidase/D-alanyl-D-alanine-endopeptidase [Burkholderiales bacterium]|nr:D-alanyl-D-alanine carboxypeptidase/D-alanyl-D-alanine-endopeptidase [Burkholderiales bacterium]
MLNARRGILRLAVLVLVTLASGQASAEKKVLPPQLSAALRGSGVPADAAAVVVQEIGATHPLVQWNVDRPMNPASTMKLLTTLAGLELLGPSYTWRTEVYAQGEQTGDSLTGDLVLKGYGDPKLTLENFWLLLQELRSRGLREIRGDLVIDRSFFDVEIGDPGRFDNEPTRPYNVLPDALLLNFKSVRLQFVPAPDRRSVQIIASPELPELVLLNQVTPYDGACESWPERPQPQGDSTLLFEGPFPIGCGERARSFALLSPDQYVHSLFRKLWSELNGSFNGTVRIGKPSSTARLLLTWQSPPLSELIRDINKFSNNVMARQLFLTLSADEDPPGSIQKSTDKVRRWLQEVGIDANELVLENGAGLSRIERISAGSLARILLRAYAGALMPEYLASLPIVGVDGTARHRLNGSPATGRAHIKTGSLEGVRAIAGYVLDHRGKWLVVVSIVNHPSAGAAQSFQDAVIEWAYQRGSDTCCNSCRQCAIR